MSSRGWIIRPEDPVRYGDAYRQMHELAERRLRGEVPDTLILLEHPPVFTAGRRSDPAHVRWAEHQIEEAGAEFHFVDRGGSVTFHGPGQLVGYPILDLGPQPDVIAYLRALEEVVIRACRRIGVKLGRDPARTGVWSGDRKICAIGVKLARTRVTLHGFALNCTTDLSWFDAIVPCGLGDRGVGSLTDFAGREVSVEEMAGNVQDEFSSVFGIRFTAAPGEVRARFPADRHRHALT
jgi:lipoyl(octanoyl) transferase